MKQTRSILLALSLLFAVTLFSQVKIKVACIGNSITAGYGLKPAEAYPAQLQLLLGDSYEVRNFGFSARTLLNKGNLPYMKEKMYQEALGWLPDIVVIKLGTNDSKPGNWKFQKEFVGDLKNMVKQVKHLSSHPAVFLCLPIPAFPNAPNFHAEWGINDSVIANGVIPKIKSVQKSMRTRLIDLRTPFLGKTEWVYDGIHPNAEGAKIIARLVYEQLMFKPGSPKK